jgi:methylglyoxal synthase
LSGKHCLLSVAGIFFSFLKNLFMAVTRKIKSVKRIAMVAHDNKKAEIVDWATYNKDVLKEHELFATGTTGRMIEERLNLPVNKLLSGPLGGDQQIGAMIAEGKLDIVIFFWDPMEQQPHDSDVKALLRIAVAWNILTASNRTTADFIMASTLMDDEYEIIIPDYSGYKNRRIG